MSGRSTKRVQKGSRAKGSSLEELEKEAKSFAKKTTSTKGSTKEDKPLTSRQQLAGYALAGLLARSSGLISKSDIRREAYDWADWMLEDE